MIGFGKIISTYIFSILLILIITAIAQSAHAVTPSEVKELRTKATLAQKKLRIAIEEGKDVSNIVPMMKRVKQLGDEKRIKEANALLDNILIEFERLNESASPGKHQVSNAKGAFSSPRKVNIAGYKYSAMEAFISRDGKFLFFNSDETDTRKTDKNIYYAKRIDDTNFKFMGEVKGINSAEVDGVPTMDNNSNFYYVSVVHYGKKNGFATVYSGKFNDGRVTDIKSHPELSLNTPGWLNMDIEISADGKTLYATQTYFGNGPPPKKSYFFVAHLKDGRFVIDKRSDEIFKSINTDDLEYGASISTNELEILFTRLNFDHGAKFASYRATRPNKDAPFTAPTRIEAITGIAEAPAITNDGQLLYFHKKKGGRFNLYLLERNVN